MPQAVGSATSRYGVPFEGSDVDADVAFALNTAIPRNWPRPLRELSMDAPNPICPPEVPPDKVAPNVDPPVPGVVSSADAVVVSASDCRDLATVLLVTADKLDELADDQEDER